MSYAYYPGCSMHATGRAYGESIQAIAGPLGIELKEVHDWNCCGATAYMGINETLSHCLSARNLALAAEQGKEIVAPCNACYTNLQKANHYLADYPELKEKVATALAEAGLKYDGGVQVRHMLEVIVDDVGLEKVRSLSRRSLQGLKVAPYYGCQIVRPYGINDDPEEPRKLDRLIEALGGVAVKYPLKVNCCGGSLVGTREEVALRLCRNLLLCAEQNGAEVIAVACPLCQINLDLYQSRINKAYGTEFRIPILYFTQLVGLAFGIEPKQLGIGREATPLGVKLAGLAEVRA